MRVAIVTDTGCDLPQGAADGYAIQYVPLLYRFGNEEFPDKTMPMQEFLNRVERIWPTTSAPSPGDYIEAFRKALQDHAHALCITLTSKHSASYASAVLASQYFPDGQVTVVDSASLSIGQGLQVLAAAKAAQIGSSLEEIVSRVKALQRRSHLFISLDTVKYLVRGGRASALSGFLAGVLQIRPVLTLVEGQLKLIDKPRGRLASIQSLLKRALAHFPAEFVAAGHVGCQEEAQELVAALSQESGFVEKDISLVETGAAIATHGGPGTLGVVVVSKEEQAA